MVLAIGLVVDDAIVVVENVYRHIEEGKTPLQAALVGAREIIGPIIAMTITLAAVYAPIGFLGGLTGALFREFAFTLAGAVFISGIIALTLSPMMTSVLLTSNLHQGKFAQLVDRVFGRVTNWYSDHLSRTLNYRFAMLSFVVGVFAAVGFMFVNSARELAPVEDQGVIISALKGPQFVNLDFTTAYTLKLTEILKKYPEAEAFFTFAGRRRHEPGHVRGDVEAVERTQALGQTVVAGTAEGPEPARRRHRLCLYAAAVARIVRHAARLVRDLEHRRLPSRFTRRWKS